MNPNDQIQLDTITRKRVQDFLSDINEDLGFPEEVTARVVNLLKGVYQFGFMEMLATTQTPITDPELAVLVNLMAKLYQELDNKEESTQTVCIKCRQTGTHADDCTNRNKEETRQ